MNLFVINNPILPQAEGNRQPAVGQCVGATGDTMSARDLIAQIALGPGRALVAPSTKAGKLLHGVAKGLAIAKLKIDAALLVALNRDRTCAG